MSQIDAQGHQNDELYKIRHSAEHVLTQAVEQLYPNQTIRVMGPATDDGFYMDFEPLGDLKISDADFPQLEAKMAKIIKANLPIVRKEISLDEAKKIFADNPYKMDWLNSITDGGEVISVYHTADQYFDLCAGTHASSTGEIKAFKLLSIAGAYWHGDEKNKMLTRIYGTAFQSKEELEKYLNFLAEAERRDHRRLGRELKLFSFSDLVGSGLPLFTPKGTFIRKTLNDYIESTQSSNGYTQVWTPQIVKAKLFQISGHYDKYKDSMFRVNSNYSEDEFFLKPMNCPQHTQIYASEPRSYRDLPVRLTDFAMLYRDEKPGELNGLARVRSFSQDDCHIFCREDQVDEEIDKALTMTKNIMATFGFKYRYRLSTRDLEHPEKYIGDPTTWDKVEKWAIEIMKRNRIDYFDGPGEAAFYAPKMDLMATDALGREWQLSTIQIDFFAPERFGLEYTDKDGTKKRPVMLHRAILGSSERFMIVMIEHFAGAFPVWLSPVQAKIIPITDSQHEYANKVLAKLIGKGIRAEIDDRSEKMQGKIRDAQLEKIPYMLIICKREAESNSVAVRQRDGQDLGAINVDDFTAKVKDQIFTKSLNLIQ